MASLIVYTSGHRHSLTVCEAFAKGAGLPVCRDLSGLRAGGMFTYGNLRGLKPLLDAAIAQRREWWYADNGYFGAGHYGGYYRVTKNAFQHSGQGDAHRARFEQHRIPVLKWQTQGRHILLCPPGKLHGELFDYDAAGWASETLAALLATSNRPVRVRTKPSKNGGSVPLSEDLKNCHALVTRASNAAVEAVLQGVPVFCTHPCAAYRMGNPNVREIESPRYPDDREQWAANLAANQWTLNEMRDGSCWRDLMGER